MKMCSALFFFKPQRGSAVIWPTEFINWSTLMAWILMLYSTVYGKYVLLATVSKTTCMKVMVDVYIYGLKKTSCIPIFLLMSY